MKKTFIPPWKWSWYFDLIEPCCEVPTVCGCLNFYGLSFWLDFFSNIGNSLVLRATLSLVTKKIRYRQLMFLMFLCDVLIIVNIWRDQSILSKTVMLTDNINLCFLKHHCDQKNSSLQLAYRCYCHYNAVLVPRLVNKKGQI